MKSRVRIAWSILAAVALLAVCGHFLVHWATHQTLEQLEAARAWAGAGQFDKAAAQVAELVEGFERHEHLLEFFLKRETVASVSVNLHGLAAYTNADSIYDLASELDKAAQQVRMLEHLFCSVF